ncbi:M4 family metallopeptidase [Actinomadura rupiterrae]|uniref:M4 family metallopeptidase n=1 Tax=Actinomadura rupiterrae TaxID=559627 RepID=UPI0020A3D7DC|nr:M4 family metallopeptidase [Actinomadura rupiterrae]MCP2335542.1 bacillolysin [Actinomadura rupiterrae]
MSPQRPLLAGAALAAVLAASLTVPRAASAAPADDPPPPSGALPGGVQTGTSAPALVEGLDEKAASSDPVKAARAHLAEPRYKIKDTARDLAPLDVVADGTQKTVRFEQRYQGLPVLGGQYLVHLDRDRVTGAGGRYLTDLSVDTRPTVPEASARKAALFRTIEPRGKAGLAELRKAAVQNLGLAVVPRGRGQLTWHFRIGGSLRGKPVLREVYIDAHGTGAALSYDRLQEAEGPVQASGKDAHGRDRTFPAWRRADGKVEMRDTTRAAGGIVTYDAQGKDVSVFEGRQLPADTAVAASDSTVFPQSATDSGAVDAHWAAGQVYDFYKRLGRDGLDGKGGPINSVVNVTAGGGVFENAFWDGTKMVYGGGGRDYYSFASSLDVDGHEMTHGVVEHTANLAYFGQSGAMNEGIADYFGNAIQLDALKMPMTDPRAALLGEELCRTGTPEQCALRRLDDNRNATRDYIGATIRIDGAGVHLNSTIFSGALWDIRKALGGGRGDKLAYKALSEYMTPLDGFTDGRRAVEAAARALHYSGKDRTVVRQAFERHGIKPGWERRIGLDARILKANLSDDASPDVAGNRYVFTDSSPDGAELPSVYTGDLRGGTPVKVFGEDGVWPWPLSTDGRTVAWVQINLNTGTFDVVTRPADLSAPATVRYSTPGSIQDVALDGNLLAFTEVSPDGSSADVWYMRLGDQGPVDVNPSYAEQTMQVTVKDGRIGYIKYRPDGSQRPAVYDTATGKETDIASKGRADLPYLTRSTLFFIDDTDADPNRAGISRAGVDGTGLASVLADGPNAPRITGMKANDSWVTFGALPGGDVFTNAGAPKLFQLPARGGTPVRMSCDRGEQGRFGIGDGHRVVWADGTAGRADLVTRDRSVGACR